MDDRQRRAFELVREAARKLQDARTILASQDRHYTKLVGLGRDVRNLAIAIEEASPTIEPERKATCGYIVAQTNITTDIPCGCELPCTRHP